MFQMKVDPSKVMGALTELEQKQLPFAVSLALNRVANDAQVAERNRMKAAFRMRRETWNLQGIYIAKEDRANKSTWRVVLQVQANRDYLNKFEQGGSREPVHGRFRWVPNAEVFGRKIISRADPLHPKNLKFQRHGATMQGNESTFIVKGKGGQQMVLQRQDRGLTKGSKRNLSRLTLDNYRGGQGPAMRKEKLSLSRQAGTRLLYRLVSRYAVPASLEFAGTVQRTVQAQWPTRMQQAMAEALRSAK